MFDIFNSIAEAVIATGEVVLDYTEYTPVGEALEAVATAVVEGVE